MIALEVAQELLLGVTKASEIEAVSIYEANGRVLAESIYSPIDSPPFDKSPLDGYAVKAETLKDVTVERPKRVKVIDKIYAGEVSYKEIEIDEAIRIMTGAKIPSGADCIVKQEDTEIINDSLVNILVTHNAKDNIIFKGEDFRKDSLIVKKNCLLNPSNITAIASVGINKIKVYKRPVVGIITTGDEIQNPGEKLLSGKIFNSNKAFLYTRLLELGAIPKIYDIVGDTIKDIKKTVKFASEECDIIISTGGVSVGEKDLVKEAVRALNYEILFWKIAIKPGSPMFGATNTKVVYIGLSGTPVAAATTFELTVRPVIAKMLNCEELNLKKITCRLGDEFSKVSPKRRFLRVRVEEGLENRVYINNIYQSPGQINTMINSTALLEIKPNEKLLINDIVEIIK